MKGEDISMTAGRTVNSQSTDWCTPLRYIEAVKQVFGGIIELDPCSNQWSKVNAKVELSLPKSDGLNANWNYKTIYVNPPYGADRQRKTTIKSWLCKCANANKQFHSEVLALIPVASNTSHWKEYIWGKAIAVCFLYETRLKFLEDGNKEGKGAPMSCAMIYWGKKYEKFFSTFLKFGAVVDLRQLTDQSIGEEIAFKKGEKPFKNHSNYAQQMGLF